MAWYSLAELWIMCLFLFFLLYLYMYLLCDNKRYWIELKISFNENISISIKISLKFVAKGPINNIPDNGVAPTRRQAIIWTNDG